MVDRERFLEWRDLLNVLLRDTVSDADAVEILLFYHVDPWLRGQADQEEKEALVLAKRIVGDGLIGWIAETKQPRPFSFEVSRSGSEKFTGAIFWNPTLIVETMRTVEGTNKVVGSFKETFLTAARAYQKLTADGTFVSYSGQIP